MYSEELDYLVPTYSQFKVVPHKAYGSWVWDIEGNKYLDFCSGIATVSLGHCHPRLTKALKEQADKLWHVSNLYIISWQIELAKKLVKISKLDKVFFCNSGAEANEAAIKFARLYGKKRKNGAYKIITANNGFHGRTLAMVAATAQEKVKKGFEPLPEGFVHVNYNDVDAIKNAVDSKTCAIMLEPVQGEAGVVIPDSDYLKEVKSICEEEDILLILDEVQTGMGRCGTWFTCERFEVRPDIITVAKGLGSGFPIGAAIVSDRVAQTVHKSAHASTFGGNPLATRVACEVIDTMEEENVLENVKYLETKFKEWARDNLQQKDSVKDVRCIGLLIAIEFTQPIANQVIEKAIDNGLLLAPSGDRTIRIIPPLTIDKKDFMYGLSIVKDLIK